MGTEGNPILVAHEIVKTTPAASPESVSPLPESPTTPEITPPVAAPEKPEEKFAQKFAALARREKAARERETALKTRDAELQAKLAELDEFKKDPFAYHEKQDPLALKKWNERKIKGISGPTTEEQIAELKKQFVDEAEAKKKAEADAVAEQARVAKEQYDQTVFETKENISHFISNNPEYELLQAEATDNPDFSKSLVFYVMEEFYKAHQKVLSFKEACQMAEDHLFEKYQQRLNVPKLKTRSATPEENKAAGSTASKPLSPSSQAIAGTTQTLTNQVNNDIPHRGEKRLSIEESKERLAREFIRFIP